MGRPLPPRGADDGSGEDDMVQNVEERLLSSSRAATTSSSTTMGITSGFKRSGVLTIGCAFLFFALGYVSSPTRGTPILSSSSSSSPSLIANVPSSSLSSSSSHRSAMTSFPHLGSSFPQKNRHRFELLGGKEEQEQEEEEEEEKHRKGRKETSKSTRNDKTDDEEDDDEKRSKIEKGFKETNALDAEIELEKDEHLLEHLQKSLNDNIETQEKETLKLVKMKVDEQDAERMKEEEELTEEELGIHHSNEDANVANNDSGSSSDKNNKDDGSELGFKEKDNESEVKNATTPTTFEDSILKNVSSELDEVIRDGKQSKSKVGDIVPRAAAFASMDDELQDVLDAVDAVEGSGGENSVNERNDVKLAHEKASSLSSPSQSLERGERKAILPKGNPEETLGWTEADATTINPESITESAQSGVRSLVLNPEIVHDLKEKFEDMKNKGEVQVEGKWKKFDAEAKKEKKQMKEAKKMEEIVEESSKILDDIDAVRMAQSFDAGGGNKSFSWTFSYLYFPLIVLFSILLAVVALLIKTSEKSNLKRYGSTGSFDRSSPKRNGKNKLPTLEEEEEIYRTKDNTYPDFSNLRDFEKGNRTYNSSVESFEEDEFEDEDYDGDSIDDGSYDDDGDYDEEAFSERSSDVSSFQGFREKAIAVAKAAEEFLTNAKGGTARISNAGTFHGASKYGANESVRDGTGVSAAKKRRENGQRSSFVKSSTTKWI